MKRITFMVFVVMLALRVIPAYAAEQKTILALDNMTCSSCNYMVKGALMKVDGVSKVTVSYEHKTARITYDDAKTTVAPLIEATTNAGFPSRVVSPDKKE